MKPTAREPHGPEGTQCLDHPEAGRTGTCGRRRVSYQQRRHSLPRRNAVEGWWASTGATTSELDAVPTKVMAAVSMVEKCAREDMSVEANASPATTQP